MRICKSRAAHPRVNERALTLLIMVPRQMATIATWTEQLNTCFLMIISRLVLGRSQFARRIVGFAVSVGLTRRVWKQPARGWVLRLPDDELYTGTRVAPQLEANVGIRVRANIHAAHVVDVVFRIGRLTLRRR